MLAILLAWLAVAQPAAPPHSLMSSTATHRSFHLRLLDPRLKGLIENAEQRSATFASLLDRLEGTDLIVYVERVTTLSRALRGHTRLGAVRGSVRYVRIDIRADQSANESVATLAHELRHAIEIGEAREVRSEADLCALYQRIGEERNWLRFETTEADSVGRQVRIELVEPH